METSNPDQLKKLLSENANLWRGGELAGNSKDSISTAYEKLDAILPNKGWPQHGLIELISKNWGMGEISLFIPLMKWFTQQKYWLAWISPPHIPYAPALVNAGVDINYMIIVDSNTSKRDAIWSMEKSLQSNACGLVFSWLDKPSNAATRRLQLAAESGKTLGVLFNQSPSPQSFASLRLQVQSKQNNPSEFHISVLKARGTLNCHAVTLNLPW